MLKSREALTPAARRLPATRQLAAVSALDGLDRGGLAERCGVSLPHLSNVFAGRRPGRRLLAAIERETGIPARDLAAAIRAEAGQR